MFRNTPGDGGRYLLMAAVLTLPAIVRAQEARVSNESLLTIRVGIHTYASDGVLKEDELQRYQTLFRSLAGAAMANFHRPIYIQAAAGSYADIYDWCKNDLIDFAVVTAGVFAKLHETTQGRWIYLCTMGQGETLDRFEYGIQCVVHRDSKLNTLEDVKRAFLAGDLQIFMVGKLSTSGGIFPRAYLKQNGFQLGDNDITFTGTHDNCLKELVRVAEGQATAEPPAAQPAAAQQADQQAIQAGPRVAASEPRKRECIAFVWDGAFLEGRDQGNLPIKSLPLAGLDREKLPESAVVVRKEFYEENHEFYDKLLGRGDFKRLDDHEAKYQRILAWSREYGEEEMGSEEGSSWEELFAQLVRYQRETQKSPRVALVLAGGGAKCAYQVGVAQVVEQKFREFRGRNESLKDCDISLVVGTSGGALNALPIAMGTYGTAQGVETIESVWSELDAREILLLEPAVCVGIGLTLSLLYALVILLFVRLRWRHKRLFRHEHRAKATVAAFWGIGGAHLAWWLISRSTGWKLPWSLLLGNLHTVYVLWAIAAAATWIVGTLLIVAGTAIWLADLRKRRRGSYLALSADKAREVIVWLTLLTIVLGTPIVLAAASHFSLSKGLEHTIANAAQRLVNERLAARNCPSVETNDLRELSRVVLDPRNKLLERDLIITATVLKGPRQRFTESDVYFFAGANRARSGGQACELQPDKRFIDLETGDRQQFLLDAVLGSGAVFPFFPARTLNDCPRPGEQLHLVDGSFGHHVPIEAALRWGATHVLVVDPSPTAPLDFRTDRSLLENSRLALGHLFEQAQKLDKQAQQIRMADRQPLEIYRVNPEQTRHHISLLSFARVPIRYAIEEATVSIAAGSDRFLRQLNPPYFLPELDTLATRGTP